ncbi:hypothetical protein AB0H83_37840 [Dactylosporangium sp. NPDC050688]|uniref:hypothetical protein n=1 Tax=Dactylosporangium sp. NPDC050688 TaxID=3157217 RepID=UPI00340B8DDF
MTWIAWRQQRMQVLLSIALIAVVTGVLVYFRFDAVTYMADHGISGCVDIDDGRCSTSAMDAFAGRYKSYVAVLPLVLLCLPVLLGMFAGAPLFAREFEQGTHIFALTQSVGRIRWWSTKLLIAAVPVLAGTALLGLVATWSLRPLSFVAHGRMTTPGFETQGIVVTAYTLLAIAVGATAGLLWRNTVAAMALTIACYLLLLIGVAAVARPNYTDPVERRGTVAEGNAIGSQSGRSLVPDDAWRVGSAYYNAAGTAVDFDPSSCKSTDGTIETCLSRQQIATISASFHPDGQFWRLQLTESLIFLVAATALLTLGAWALLKRLL